MARATGRTFLTAITDDAPALEGYHRHGVFTYALLDALDHTDVNNNGLIEVSGLADYIDQKVPDYAFEASELRQIPQRSVVGNNFPPTNKLAVLTASTGPTVASIAVPPTIAAVPTKPISSTPADVFNRTNDTGTSIQRLPVGTLVTVVRTDGAWTLVAKEGKSVGYVAQTALAPIQ